MDQCGHRMLVVQQQEGRQNSGESQLTFVNPAGKAALVAKPGFGSGGQPSAQCLAAVSSGSLKERLNL